jgi:hypothetical protein
MDTESMDPPVTLATIRQMLAALETVTTAGQSHLMSKLIAIIDGEVSRALGRGGPRNDAMLREQLALLKREADRPAPSVPAFVDRAEGLIALVVDGGRNRHAPIRGAP